MLTSGAGSEVSAGPVTMEQTQTGWQNASLVGQTIGNLAIDSGGSDVPTAGPLYVHVQTNGTVTITGSPVADNNYNPLSGQKDTTTP